MLSSLFLLKEPSTMGTKFAPTTFATSAEEGLAALDAYSVESGRVVTNALPDVNNVVNVAGLAGMRGGNLSAALNYFSPKNGLGIQVNADSLLKGIIGSNPALSSAMSQLTGNARANVLSNSGYANIQATVGGISSTINNTDLGSLQAVGGLIGGLAGTPYPVAFTDITGLTNLTTNIVVQGASMGMPDVYLNISTGLNNPAIMRGVTRNLAPVIINRSSTNLLDNCSQGPYRGQLTAARPSFIQDYSRAYRAPAQTRQQTYRPTLNSTRASFSRLDPSWKNSRALGGPAARTLNLDRAWDTSDDFDQLLQANANYASVPVPTSNYATMDTSCRAVQNEANLPYDMELAQASALKRAMPAQERQRVKDPLSSLLAAFPLVPIR